MASADDDCHVGDDMDTLTVMNKDVVMEASSSNVIKQFHYFKAPKISFLHVLNIL